ncbi:permease prefix domain 1-containing protein [Streptomyces sp. NPDC014894]|uniref:permease prefix domain 1-containing protein n=1 Tax=unclassified Streptomyces TaxID=2593676 RepID=UPI0037001938
MSPAPAGSPAAGDLVEEYVTALAAAVHGPARVKARMVEEIRDGLAETVAARTREGMSRPEAARHAIREFGTVEELAPGWQAELTVAAARHAARSAALALPLLLLCGVLAYGASGGQGWGLRLLAVHLAAVAAVAALLAAGTPAVTGVFARRRSVPSRLPLVVAWTGTATAMATALAVLGLAAASIAAQNWPLTALAAALAAVSHALIAGPARACRHCARLIPTA